MTSLVKSSAEILSDLYPDDPCATYAHRRKVATYAGYQWHVGRKETPCDPCRNARNEYRRAHEYRRGVQSDDRLKAYRKHGTRTGYRAHLARRQKPCASCRKAHADYARAWNRKRKAERGKVAA